MAQTIAAFSPFTSGTFVFTARNAALQYWNGSAFEDYNAANIATYAIAATASGQWYSASVDDAVVTFDLRRRAGEDLATTDVPIYEGRTDSAILAAVEGVGGGATPQQIWEYATRTLTSGAGLTTEQATQLANLLKLAQAQTR